MVVEKGSLVEHFFEEFNLQEADELAKLMACEMLYIVNVQFKSSSGDDGDKDAIKRESFPVGLTPKDEALMSLLDIAEGWGNDLIYAFSVYLEKLGIESKLVDKLESPRKSQDYYSKGFGAIHKFLLDLGRVYK